MTNKKTNKTVANSDSLISWAQPSPPVTNPKFVKIG
jgi:hypothetical protein